MKNRSNTLSDESVNRLIIEYRKYMDEAELLTYKADSLKQELKYSGEYDDKISSLEDTATRIISDIIISFNGMVERQVQWAINKYGDGDDKKRPPHGMDFGDLKTEALRELYGLLGKLKGEWRFRMDSPKTFADVARRNIQHRLKHAIGKHCVKNSELLWAYVMLDKLVQVGRQEVFKLNRPVGFRHVCEVLNIPYRVARGLLNICQYNIRSETENGFHIADNFQSSEDRSSLTTHRHYNELKERVDSRCKNREKHVLTMLTGSNAFFEVSINSVLALCPELTERLEVIQNGVLDNIHDDTLKDSVSDFFDLRLNATKQPSKEALDYLGLGASFGEPSQN